MIKRLLVPLVLAASLSTSGCTIAALAHGASHQSDPHYSPGTDLLVGVLLDGLMIAALTQIDFGGVYSGPD